MHNQALHSLSKRQILNLALAARKEGRLYNSRNSQLEDVFRGSVDRFCDIADKIRHSKKVLDVGAGHGILLSLLIELGHECYALDISDSRGNHPEVYFKKPIHFQTSNVEVDPLPFESEFFDAVVCCQVLEHFTHSHLNTMREIYRVLKPGGVIEVDVPNAVCFRNRSRIIRGKHITYNYEEHYLYAKPILYKGMSFYPLRHNREFTKNELVILLKAAQFKKVHVSFLKSRRYREGFEKFRSMGSVIRDLIPSFRKSLIAFAEK